MNDRTFSFFIVLCVVLAMFLGFRYGEQNALSRTSLKLDSVAVKYDSAISYVGLNIKDSTVFSYEKVVDTIPFPEAIDTNAIISDYFVKREFEVAYRDTNIAINIRPVIALNSLDSLSFDYSVIRPSVVNYYSPKSVTEWYVGAEAGAMNVSPFVMVNIKDRWMVGASYNLVSPSFNVAVGVRIF